MTWDHPLAWCLVHDSHLKNRQILPLSGCANRPCMRDSAFPQLFSSRPCGHRMNKTDLSSRTHWKAILNHGLASSNLPLVLGPSSKESPLPTLGRSTAASPVA